MLQGILIKIKRERAVIPKDFKRPKAFTSRILDWLLYFNASVKAADVTLCSSLRAAR